MTGNGDRLSSAQWGSPSAPEKSRAYPLPELHTWRPRDHTRGRAHAGLGSHCCWRLPALWLPCLGRHMERRPSTATSSSKQQQAGQSPGSERSSLQRRAGLQGRSCGRAALHAGPCSDEVRPAGRKDSQSLGSLAPIWSPLGDGRRDGTQARPELRREAAEDAQVTSGKTDSSYSLSFPQVSLLLTPVFTTYLSEGVSHVGEGKQVPQSPAQGALAVKHGEPLREGEPQGRGECRVSGVQLPLPTNRRNGLQAQLG